MTKRPRKKNPQLQVVEPVTNGRKGESIPKAARIRAQRIWAYLRREFGRTVH